VFVSHPRCATDAAIRKLKENGGIIMISFIPAHTNQDSAAADVNDVVNHIIHVANLIGFDHIGIGSGTSYIATLPISI
jgi:membrane dipeptidase